MKILVVGGGLGGVAFAHAARGLIQGPDVEVFVFERDVSESSREQGYTIGVNFEGGEALLQCLRGSPDAHRAVKNLLSSPKAFIMADRNCNELVRFNSAGWFVERKSLRDALLLGVKVVYGKRFVRFEEQAEGRVVVFFEDGSSEEGDVLVGADGCKSAMRAQRAPALHLDPAGVVSVCAEVLVKDVPREILSLLEGGDMARLVSRAQGSLLMYRPTAEKMWWVLTLQDGHRPSKEDDPASIPSWAASFCQRAGYSAPVLNLIGNTIPATSFYQVEVSAVRPPPAGVDPMGGHADSAVTLLGDAAHAMTTHRGAGANTTWMDAIDLAQALSAQDKAIPARLRAYEAKMFKRGFRMIKESAQGTNMITMSGTPAVVRDVVLTTAGHIQRHPYLIMTALASLAGALIVTVMKRHT